MPARATAVPTRAVRDAHRDKSLIPREDELAVFPLTSH
jgi:hypothetical protein